MKLSIIIPVYNEESTVGEVIEQVLSVELPGVEKEVIVVDDGSTDGTAEVLKHEQSEHADVVTVCSSQKNFGKGIAVRIGLKYVTGEIVLIQDADLELDPKEYRIGFEFCPEVTAKLLKRGYPITELPITYRPRTEVEGKKLRFVQDGLTAVLTLLKYRFHN